MLKVNFEWTGFWNRSAVRSNCYGKDRKKKEATGMGLYLAQRLCKKLGLVLCITSDEGVGTTVTIGFPMTDFHKSTLYTTID